MPPTMTTDRSAPATRGDLDILKSQLRREIRAEVESALASRLVREQRRNDLKEVLVGWPVRQERRNDVEEVLGRWDIRRQRREDIQSVLRERSSTILFHVVTTVAAILIAVFFVLSIDSDKSPDESDGTSPPQATESTTASVVEPVR